MELSFVRIIDLLIAADPRTQRAIAIAAGLKPKELSDKLKGKHKKLTEDDVKAIGKVLRVDSSVLMNAVSKTRLLALAKDREKSSLEIGKPSKVSEPVDLNAYKAARQVEVDQRLEVLETIAKSSGLVAIDRYASIAAGGLDDSATVRNGVAWVPKRFGSCYALDVIGTSMVEAGIDPGDTLIVKLSKTAREERITVALMDNGATVKRYRLIDGEPVLCAEGEGHPNIPASDGFKVQGLVLAIYKPQ